MTPADVVISLFGSVRKCAKALNRHQSSVSYWRRSGRVPHDVQIIILKKAKAGELQIEAEQLIIGAH